MEVIIEYDSHIDTLCPYCTVGWAVSRCADVTVNPETGTANPETVNPETELQHGVYVLFNLPYHPQLIVVICPRCEPPVDVVFSNKPALGVIISYA